MKVIAFTQKGTNKAENEDRIVVGKSVLAEGMLVSELRTGILAIADGVGGNNAGALASHFVANRVTYLDAIDVDCLSSINNDLLAASESAERCKGMATTLAGLCFSDNKAQLFSIGNTRVYVLQSRQYLKQLTIDDTVLNYLRSTGQLSPEQEDSFERKNEIMACFGGGSVDLFKIKVANIDLPKTPVVITSDGIHDYVTVDDMESIIVENGISDDTCVEIVQAARRNGSLDDASIVLCEIE